jgi:hypothetical protein
MVSARIATSNPHSAMHRPRSNGMLSVMIGVEIKQMPAPSEQTDLPDVCRCDGQELCTINSWVSRPKEHALCSYQGKAVRWMSHVYSVGQSMPIEEPQLEQESSRKQMTITFPQKDIWRIDALVLDFSSWKCPMTNDKMALPPFSAKRPRRDSEDLPAQDPLKLIMKQMDKSETRVGVLEGTLRNVPLTFPDAVEIVAVAVECYEMIMTLCVAAALTNHAWKLECA